MKSLKIVTTVLIVLAFFPKPNVQAYPMIEIVGESYHASGSARDLWGQSYSYSVTQSSPPAFGEITQNITRIDPWGAVFDEDGPETWHIESLATRYSDGEGICFHAHQISVCYLCEGTNIDCHPRASFVVDFMLSGSQARRVWVDAWRSVTSESWATATLVDMTCDQSWIILGDDPYESPAPPDEICLTLRLYPEHTYRLEAVAYEMNTHSSSIDVSFSPIPAPGALLLGTLGAGLVGCLRRRRALSVSG